MFYPKTDLGTSDEILRGLRRQATEKATRLADSVHELASELLGHRPRAITLADNKGTFRTIFDIVDSDGQFWVLRLNDADVHDFGMCLDARAGAHLLSHNVPVIPVEHLDLSRRRYPFDFTLMRRATGDPLTDVAATDAKFRPVLVALGAIIARLHRISLPDYGLIVPEAEAAAVCQIGRGTHNSWYGYLKLHLVAHIDCCRRIGAISTTESTEIERRLSDGFARLDDVPARLLHGDLGGHNIFARGAEVAAIIDWEDCLSGDPVYDVAFWGTFHRDEHLIPFLEGYLNGAPAGGDFMQRYWLYYLRISLAKTVHRHRFGYTDPPGRAPASARIQKALDRLRALSPVML